MRTFSFLVLALLPFSGVACKTAVDDLTLDQATPVRLADDRLQTTVTVACLGDCSAEASHCVQVTWPANDPTAPMHDIVEVCSKTAPTLGAPETIVVTSQGPIAENTAELEEIQLLDGSGNPIPQDVSAEGGVETTPIEAISVP
jgi:hypothetical protein